MTTYCNQGDSPIIKYKFQGDTKDRTFRSKYAPIEVITRETPINSSDDYREDGYAIDPFPGNSSRNWATVRDHKYFFIPGDRWQGFNGSPHQVAIVGCNGTGFAKVADCGAHPAYAYCDCLVTSVAGGVPLVNTSIICPSSKNKRCSIEIKYNGIILFQDQGNSPVNYSVQCGKCPDSQHECESKVYPYYCCNSCAETANKINNLASKVGK
ncbi:hypothetical protein I8748_16460 [Nostoc sp. CENA67]|uniref:Uncharacterized protein n=1 Tax=Amazonocrinis nigriterrae CENA67 TaxID=2794033 RepID=A0A8J7L7T8_9NOST|nr:hypothetical protein [Amazonocrinis nigriterrae]MBH8563764.1 hypothetical protein [Amazonocrinis nigriterrae CENA67]